MTPASLLSENAAVCLQTKPLEGTDDHLVAVNEQNVEHTITSPPSVPPGDKKFYQDILVSFHSITLFHTALTAFLWRIRSFFLSKTVPCSVATQSNYTVDSGVLYFP